MTHEEVIYATIFLGSWVGVIVISVIYSVVDWIRRRAMENDRD